MKRFKTTARQGEIMIVKVADIPQEAVPVAPTDGLVIVGHSETGHHHVMVAERTKLFEQPDSLTRFLDVSEEDMLEHRRNFDTHEPIVFEPGKYRVQIRREYTPEGFRRVAD